MLPLTNSDFTKEGGIVLEWLLHAEVQSSCPFMGPMCTTGDHLSNELFLQNFNKHPAVGSAHSPGNPQDSTVRNHCIKGWLFKFLMFFSFWCLILLFSQSKGSNKLQWMQLINIYFNCYVSNWMGRKDPKLLKGQSSSLKFCYRLWCHSFTSRAVFFTSLNALLARFGCSF